MSEQAKRIEKSRRAYVAALGTEREKIERRAFEKVIAEVRAETATQRTAARTA